jgi:hypothetical protein
MSSVATAQALTRDIGELLAPRMPAKVQIEMVYRELVKRRQKFTRRRVRAFFFGENARFDYEELLAIEELRAEEELKRARRQFAASAIVLAAHHEQAGETVARDSLLELGRRHGALDLSRDGGAAR